MKHTFLSCYVLWVPTYVLMVENCIHVYLKSLYALHRVSSFQTLFWSCQKKTMWSPILYVVCTWVCIHVCSMWYRMWYVLQNWSLYPYTLMYPHGTWTQWSLGRDTHMWPQQTWGQRSSRGQWPLVQVFEKSVRHFIHILWCIFMGLGHNDPWVESHMWPQQTWGRRSSRGQRPLVQVFWKKGHCIHVPWCIFMGLRYNDLWVELHMWPQQKWSHRSSRGHWVIDLLVKFLKSSHWHCIHILWCITMGVGHIDPWVESHTRHQHTWGQRSSKGHLGLLTFWLKLLKNGQ